MVRGFYSAASGVLNQQKAFNTVSNNISNASTAGFKNQGALNSSFGDHLVSRMSANKDIAKNNIGGGSFMTINSSNFTDFSQGIMENTGNLMDVAIQGEGLFLVRTASNGDVLTRNGKFEIDGDGELAIQGIGKVLDEGKNPIGIEKDDFSISQAGNILVGDKSVATLFIASKGDTEKLSSVGTAAFKSAQEYVKEETGNYAILQGNLEKSNIDISQEMSKIISGQNRYQSCTQILKIYDKLNEIAVNQIGRIG